MLNKEDGLWFGKHNNDYSLLFSENYINVWTVLEAGDFNYCFFKLGLSDIWDCVLQQGGLTYVSVSSSINSDIVVISGEVEIDFESFLKSKHKLKYLPIEDVEETDQLAAHIKALKEYKK